MSTAAARARTLLKPARRTTPGLEVELFAVVLGILLAVASLRRYYPLAAPDFKAEMVPPLQGYRFTGIEGYLEAVPGYPGAAVLEFPVLAFGDLIGLTEGNIWRLISVVAIAAVVGGVLAALPLLRAAGASRTAALVAVALAVASPTAYWALRIGHPEEVLSAGLLLGAVVAAAYERPIVAGLLLGAACGKGWALAAALPVIGLMLPNWRKMLIACIVAGLTLSVLVVPALLANHSSVQVMASTGSAHIFNTAHIFWFFGEPIALATVDEQAVPQPRIGPEWTGLVSHPMIIGAGVALGLVWCITVYQRLSELQLLGPLRSDGRSRSLAGSAELASSALLVMAGILVARCYLDTWNVPYYILPALICGAIGEAMRGRVPVITLVATALMWKYHPPSDPTIRTAPDVYTATFLAWAVPFSVGYVILGLRTARTALAPPRITPAGPAAEPAAAPERAPAPQVS